MKTDLNSQDTQLSLANSRLCHRLRVRWSEVDMQKIVFNPHYLTYFDVAITRYWRELALPYELTLSNLEGDLFVKKSTLEYAASAHFDEELSVYLRCARIGNSSMTFEGGIFKGLQCLVRGEIVYVFADRTTKTAKNIPLALRELITRYEAFEQITKLRLGSWPEMRADALPLRHDVFVLEQGVAQSLEEDEWDSQALHAVLYNALGLPIATARLFSHSQTGGHTIGRMAVRQDLRGTGWGRCVLKALEDRATEDGSSTVELNAQLHAKPFYTQLGYSTVGGVFEEAGIAHIKMQKTPLR